MAAYAIMRMEKVKDPRQAGARLKHMRREIPCIVSHPERQNATLLYGAVKEYQGHAFGEIFREKTAGQKIRKNAVRAVEVVMTFSPGAAKDEDLREWAGVSLKWLGDLFGQQNIVGAMLHRDEETPHIHAMVIPVDARGKLNARAFLGGTSQRMRDLQTEYAGAVRRFGLERGIDKKITKARHQTSAEWRAKQAENALRLATYEKIYGKPAEMVFDDMTKFYAAEGELRAQQLQDDVRTPQELEELPRDTSDR